MSEGSGSAEQLLCAGLVKTTVLTRPADEVHGHLDLQHELLMSRSSVVATEKTRNGRNTLDVG